MDMAMFRNLQQQFRVEGLFEVSDPKGWATILTELTVFSVIAWGLAQVTPWSLSYWGLEFLAGLSLFRMFVILHECGHKTLFSSMTVGTTTCVIPSGMAAMAPDPVCQVYCPSILGLYH